MALNLQIAAAKLAVPSPARPDYPPAHPPIKPSPADDFRAPHGAHANRSGRAYRPTMDSGRLLGPSRFPVIAPVFSWLAFIGLILLPRSTADKIRDEGEKLCQLPTDLQYFEYRRAEEQIRRRQSRQITLDDLIEIARQRAVYCAQNGVDPSLCDLPHLLWIIAAQLGLNLRALMDKGHSRPADLNTVSSASGAAHNGAAPATGKPETEKELEGEREAPSTQGDDTWKRRADMFRSARAAFDARQYEKAIGLFIGLAGREYDELGSAESSTLTNLGRSLKRAGRLDDAALVYRTAMGIYPGHAIHKLNLAKVYVAQGKFMEAEGLLVQGLQERRWQEKEMNVKGWFLTARATTLMGLGKFEEASDAAKEAIRIGNHTLDGIYVLTRVLVSAGRRDEIKQVTNQLPPGKMKNAINNFRYRARHRTAMRNYSLALEDLETVLALESDNPLSNDFSEYASVLMRLERFSEALPYLNRAIELSGDNVFSEIYVRRGIVLRHMDKLEEARDDFGRALALETRSRQGERATTLCELGITLSLMRKRQEALRVFTRALERGGKHFRVFYERARVHQALRNFSQASADLEEAVKLDARNTPALLRLADLYKEMGIIDRAAGKLDTIEKLEPKNISMLRLRAALLRSSGKLNDAKDCLDKAAGLLSEGKALPPPSRRDLGQLDLERGMVSIELGRFDDALGFLDAARRRIPNRLKIILFQKGLALTGLGRTKEAEEAFAQSDEIERVSP